MPYIYSESTGISLLETVGFIYSFIYLLGLFEVTLGAYIFKNYLGKF